MKRFVYRILRFIANESSSDRRVKFLRKQGMKIGENTQLYTMAFGTEPYLIEIGDHVAIANGTTFTTHDGGLWCFSEEFQDYDLFGKIKIGNNVHIGMNCTILPNTSIGNNCIIGAGSIVRGKFPDNSVILGNPAMVLTRMNVQKLLYSQNPGLIRTGNMKDEEKKPLVIKHFSNNK